MENKENSIETVLELAKINYKDNFDLQESLHIADIFKNRYEKNLSMPKEKAFTKFWWMEKNIREDIVKDQLLDLTNTRKTGDFVKCPTQVI